MTYYHGTTSELNIADVLLPPKLSGRLTELGRLRNLDKVFFTCDIHSAEIYAKKAVKRYGGQPVVLIVQPLDPEVVLQEAAGTTVYMANSATVLGAIPIYTPVRVATNSVMTYTSST